MKVPAAVPRTCSSPQKGNDVGVSRGNAQAGRRHGPDRQRDVILDGPRLVIRVCPPATDLDQSGLQLLDPSRMPGPGQPGVLVFVPHVSSAETELEPAFGEQVGGRNGPREQSRFQNPTFST